MKILTVALVIIAHNTALADTPEVIFLGEVHDNSASHQRQAGKVSELQPTAVVFEMLTPAQAKAANGASLDDMADATEWEQSGWPSYAMYAPIFEALGDAVIFGAGSIREDTMAVFQSGADTVFGQNSARYGLTDDLEPDEQAARETLQFEAHCEAMPRDLMAGMVEVQRYRDAILAAAAENALAAHGAPVVVIAGAGHARIDWGAPALLAKSDPSIDVYAMAFVEAESDTPFDDVILVPKAERDDPCVALRQ